MIERVACPECGGEGWTQGVDYEDRCCGGSDWECGARGCTGPIQEQVPTQEPCQACRGEGVIDAALNPGDRS